MVEGMEGMGDVVDVAAAVLEAGMEGMAQSMEEGTEEGTEDMEEGMAGIMMMGMVGSGLGVDSRCIDRAPRLDSWIHGIGMLFVR